MVWTPLLYGYLPQFRLSTSSKAGVAEEISPSVIKAKYPNPWGVVRTTSSTPTDHSQYNEEIKTQDFASISLKTAADYASYAEHQKYDLAETECR